jgi:hypothetical protein
MNAELLKTWGAITYDMILDDALLAQALADNEWFTPYMVQQYVFSIQPWFEGDALAHLRSRYPAVARPKRIGLILAGNLPLVGLHDVLMVLLSGHEAVVKPSHKDRVLLTHLLAQSPEALRDRVRIVEAIAPDAIDYLIATGSNNTARQIAADFKDVPMLLRGNRYSVAVLDGEETGHALMDLSEDVLYYHGMGCRSVSSLLVPQGYDLAPLAAAIDAWYKPSDFGRGWEDVLRYERALQATLGREEPSCKYIVFERTAQLKPGKIGILNVVEYEDADDVPDLLDAVRADLQWIGGVQHGAFGTAQLPALDDWADGVDTLALLTGL